MEGEPLLTPYSETREAVLEELSGKLADEVVRLAEAAL